MQAFKFLCVTMVLLLIFVSSNPALAWERGQGRAAAAAAESAAAESAIAEAALTQAMNMDLSSTTRSLPASVSGLNTPVTVDVGGNSPSVSPNDLVTAAELVATSQSVNSGIKSLSVPGESGVSFTASPGAAIVIGENGTSQPSMGSISLTQIGGDGTITLASTAQASGGTLTVNASSMGAGSITVSSSTSFTAGGAIKNISLTTSNSIMLSRNLGAGGGGRIGAAKNQPQEFNTGSKIDSLNLSNPNAVEGIVRMQESNSVGGTLVVKGGVAVGGNLIVEPEDLESALRDMVIPKGVTVEFKDFSNTDSLNVSLNSSSSAQSVVINGTASFNDSTDARVNISSLVGAPVMIVGRSGSISSDSNLMIGGNGSMKINGDVSNSNVNGLIAVETNGGKGDIVLSGEMGSATTNLSLSLHGTGSLKQGNGVVTANSLSITGSMGDIGTLGTPIKTEAEEISARTTASGVVNIYNNGAATLGDSRSGNSFTFVNNGDLQVNDIEGGTSLKVLVTSGALTIADGAKVRANNGSLTLQNIATSNPSIVLGANSELSASAAKAGMANVNVLIGAATTRLDAGTIPANVQVVGNSVYFGLQGITALPLNNILTATNQSIIFNTRDVGANAITLNGGVQVSATKVSFAGNCALADEDIIDTGEFTEDTAEDTIRWQQAMAE